MKQLLLSVVPLIVGGEVVMAQEPPITLWPLTEMSSSLAGLNRSQVQYGEISIIAKNPESERSLPTDILNLESSKITQVETLQDFLEFTNLANDTARVFAEVGDDGDISFYAPAANEDGYIKVSGICRFIPFACALPPQSEFLVGLWAESQNSTIMGPHDDIDTIVSAPSWGIVIDSSGQATVLGSYADTVYSADFGELLGSDNVDLGLQVILPPANP